MRLKDEWVNIPSQYYLHLWGRNITYELRECADYDILQITNILRKKIYIHPKWYRETGRA